MMLSVATAAIVFGVGGYGLALLALGHDRLWADAPNYAVALMIPGDGYSWGAMAVISAITLAAGHKFNRKRVAFIGAVLCAIWLGFFAAGFIVSTIVSETLQSVSGAIVYSALGIIAATRAGVAR